jgi:hypothetical protein
MGNSVVKAYANKKLFLYQVLGVQKSAYLLSCFLWHILFIAGFGFAELPRMFSVKPNTLTTNDYHVLYIWLKVMAVISGSFTMIPLTYLIGFMLRHKADHAPAYLILIVYIFGYIIGELHNMFASIRDYPVALCLGCLANPFIFLIWMPKLP